MGLVYRLFGGKFNNNWLNFSNFDLLGFRGIMLVPMALPLFHFSDFTCNYIPDYPQIYLCSHCDVNDHSVGALDLHEVVHMDDKFSYESILDCFHF